MLLIGTSSLSRKLDVGDFFCPTCQSHQGYQSRGQRTWLTIYFIPVVPITPVDTHIRCDQCQARWDESVLTMDSKTVPVARREQFAAEALRAGVLVVQTAGEMSPTSIRTLLQIANGPLGLGLSRDDLGLQCSQALQSGVPAENYLRTVARAWNQEQRIEAVQVCFAAASADGSLTDRQSEVLAKMRDWFDLTEAEYRGAIESMLERSH